MRFLIFGAGALGSFVGGILSVGHEVFLVGRGQHVAAIRTQGLRISGYTELVARPKAAEKVKGDENPEIVIITTKAHDTEAAVEALRPFRSSALFISMQNGLGNAEVIARVVDKTAAAVTNQGVTFVAPGHVHHAGVGGSLLGRVKGATPKALQTVAETLSAAGMDTQVVEDIRRELWAKAIVNSAINPITALVGDVNEVIVRKGELKGLAQAVVKEGSAVARATGIPLEESDLLQRLLAVVEATAKNRSSMLQDLERGRRTEVLAINGAIVAEAQAVGLEVPLTEALMALVLAKDRKAA